jgi:hypothetical protein
VRLKNRSHNIPGGFIWIQPETNFQAPSNLSFNGVVDAVVKHRLGNPYVTKKHNLATDWNLVADEVDYANALRMKANSKWSHFITDEGFGGSSSSAPFSWQSQSKPVGAVVGAKRVAAGVKVLLDWLGSGGKAVPKEQAEKRAAVCTVCPQNRDGDWTTMFTKPVSEMLRLQLGIKNDLKLATSKDDQLFVCAACSCPNRLKVWTEIKHIQNNMDAETQERLQKEDPKCWILEELGQ